MKALETNHNLYISYVTHSSSINQSLKEKNLLNSSEDGKVIVQHQIDR